MRGIGNLILAGVLATSAALSQPAADDNGLVFSTFRGGGRNDDAQGVAVDPAGFIYVTGLVRGPRR